MKFLTSYTPIGIFYVLLLVGCRAQQTGSTDYLPEWSFTKGIEGPAVDAQGNLYAVNFQEQGTIGIVYEKGQGEVFLRLPGKSIGNGIRFDAKGNMYIADYVGHNVYRVDKGGTTPEVWAHHPDMSQPNDLTIAPSGTIYLSDPNWQEETGRLWMVDDARNIVLLEDSMGTTNGIEVSPDGKILYVNESVQRKVWQYDIQPDGTVSNKRLLLEFPDFGMDGMRCDIRGNLYITRYDKGTVVIVSPEGNILDEIRLQGKKPSNIAFGGPDGRTCYVTMADRGCFETFKAPYMGSHYERIH